VDVTQRAIVEALRDLGASVQSLADVGSGCPDLVVGWRGVNHLVEVKDGAKAPSARKLTDDEKRWHDGWRGAPVVILESADGSIEWLLRLNERRTGE
jgi:hypothetical protein